MLRHRETINGVSAEYRTLHYMIRRCHRETDRKYPRYGGRGISVCDRWRFGDGKKTGVECFIEDMGRRPSPQHSIDRIDNDGNYEPSNCRWGTATEQQRNKSTNRQLVIGGEPITLAEAAERYGLRYGLVKRRLQIGWDDEQAVGIKYRKITNGAKKIESKIPSRPLSRNLRRTQ